MSNHLNPESNSDCPLIYEIRIKGHLGKAWMTWFTGMTISLNEHGETLLTGPVVDQAALYGLLRKIRDLGIKLLSVNCIQTEAEQPSKV